MEKDFDNNSNDMKISKHEENAIENLLQFPLINAIAGRRSRRFCTGAQIPDGVFKFKSKHEPLPLSELEQLLLLSSMTGVTGWHYGIMRHKKYAPYLSNYCNAPSGRTNPSAAGFNTSDLFFTDDNGVYYFPTRDFHPPVEKMVHNKLEIQQQFLHHHKKRIKKLSNERLYIPKEEPHTEGHNTWIANHEGSTLVIPIGDLAQHMLSCIFFYTQNGYPIFDDIKKRPLPQIEYFSDIVNVDDSIPLTYMEQIAMAELTAELSTACFSGVLMLQAMGLGGWMFDGLNRYSVLGVMDGERREKKIGLGFRYDDNKDYGQTMPNPTGLENVFEAYCPPHYKDMRSALEGLVKRKFGEDGMYNSGTPGPWKDTSKVRSSAVQPTERFKECVALQAQYIYDTYGKFPATVPSIFLLTYVQAHHLDLDFYDQFFNEDSSYLDTHKKHMGIWHG